MSSMRSMNQFPFVIILLHFTLLYCTLANVDLTQKIDSLGNGEECHELDTSCRLKEQQYLLDPISFEKKHNETIDLRERLDTLCRSTLKAGVLRKVTNAVCFPLYDPVDNLSFSLQYSWLLRPVGVACSLVLFLLFLAVLHDQKSSGGRNIRYHLYFFLTIGLFLVLIQKLPAEVDYMIQHIASPTGNAIIGIVFPVLQSLRALASIQDDDDTRWLTYWVVYAAFAVLANFLDIIGEYWMYYNEAEFVFLLWLQIPYTDGCRVVHDFILTPSFVPFNALLHRFMAHRRTVIAVFLVLLNIFGVSSILFLFAVFPEFIGELCCTTIGVIFPAIASFHALSTPNAKDDKEWLTYWVAFGSFCVASQWTEEIICHLPNFHKFMLLFIVWLQLPFFQGARIVHRSILVPLLRMQGSVLKGDLQEELKRIQHLSDEQALDIVSTLLDDINDIKLKRTKKIQ